MSTSTWLPLLADTAVKGALLIAFGFAATWLLRKRSAALRHAIWTAVIGGQLLLPVVASTVPTWNVQVLPTVPSPAVGVPDAAPVASSAPAVPARSDVSAQTSSSPVETRAPAQAAAQLATRTLSDPQILATIWAIGAALVLLRLAVGTISVWRLAQSGKRIDDGPWLSLAQRISGRLGIARPLTLLKGGALGVPVTWGIFYPVVLLPDDADQWDSDRRQYVLMHEMAHVRRFDALTQLAAQLAQALFWFSPAVWLAAKRMRLEREHACDDYVLREGTLASRYADDLLSMVRTLGLPVHRRAQPSFAALAMARPSEFEGRMLAILDPHHDRHPLTRRGVAMLSVAVLVMCAPLAAFTPVARQVVQSARQVATDTVPRRMRVADSAMMRLDSVGRSARVLRDSAARDSVMRDSATRTGATVPDSAPAQMARDSAGRAARDSAARDSAMRAAEAARDSVTRTEQTATRAPISNLYSCSEWSTGNATHINAHDDGVPSTRRIQVKQTSADRCVAASILGVVDFSTDEQSVTRIGAGGFANFEERRAGSEWSVRYGTEDVSTPTVQHNGKPVPFDDSARRWLAGFLPVVLREAAINVPARVKRLRAEGGVSAVLSAIKRTRSSSAKGQHYAALLDERDLSNGDSETIVLQATSDLSESPSDLREVLARVPQAVRQSPQVREALTKSVQQMSSDTDKRLVLTQYVTAGDRDLLLGSLRAVASMSSDGERRVVLTTAAPFALNSKDRELIAAFFAAYATFGSDTDRRVTLQAAIPFGHASTEVTTAVLQAAGKMGSDSEAIIVLVAVAEQRLLTSAALREQYLAATKHLSSDSARSRALRALIQP